MKVKHTYNNEDIKIVSEECLYHGFLKLSRLKISHKLFSGKWSPTIQRELIEHKQAVGVILYDAKNELVGIIEQFRVGALGQSSNPWQFEIVAGMVEKNEILENVAIREVQEETGLTLSDIQPILSYLPSAGASNERMHLFCGSAKLLNQAGIYGLASENEDIKLHIFPFNDALEGLANGLFDSAASIIALQWLEKNRHLIKSS